MIKKLAWNTFKNTGNINTFLELMEVENVEKSLLDNESNNHINNKKDLYGNNKNEGNSTFRK
ncbi:MAG: hypothetical protein ACI4VC_01855 [Clostridia bacterium]